MVLKKKQSEPKKWAKLNVTPETRKALKRIALDEEKYVYEVIEETLRKEFPKYFREQARKITA